jgi:hypothetical protein
MQQTLAIMTIIIRKSIDLLFLTPKSHFFYRCVPTFGFSRLATMGGGGGGGVRIHSPTQNLSYIWRLRTPMQNVSVYMNMQEILLRGGTQSVSYYIYGRFCVEVCKMSPLCVGEILRGGTHNVYRYGMSGGIISTQPGHYEVKICTIVLLTDLPYTL